MERQLTIAQHMRLERVAEEDPRARVVGWRHDCGPIVCWAGGKLNAIGALGRLYPARI